MRVETTCGAAEPLGIDDGRLLDEDSRLGAVEGDRGSEARGARTRRGRRDERRAQLEELVGLDHDREPRAALLVPANLTRRRQPEDLAAYHGSVGRPWCKLGEVLSHQPHLLAVILVGCEPEHFRAHCRANATSSRSFA